MRNIKIVTDTSADLDEAYYAQNNIGLVPFYVTFDKAHYHKELIEIKKPEVYKKLRTEDVFPSTSPPSTEDYESVFQRSIEDDDDIVCLCISAKFSGSYQSATNAMKSMLVKYRSMHKYRNCRIAVIDSIQATCGQGLLLEAIVEMRDKGFDFDKIVSTVETIKETVRVYFTLDSLEYLHKGGRIGQVAYQAGTLLQLKPIIAMQNGELTPLQNVQGREKAIKKITKITGDYIGDRRNKYRLAVIHSDAEDEARALHDQLSGMEYTMAVEPQELGVTIGAHTGPSLIGICLINAGFIH